MKKSTLAEQIELKIRQMNDKYKHIKKSSSENVMKQISVLSGPQERANDMIRKDLRSHLPLIKLQGSRDVSHLKDMKSPKTTSSVPLYPNELSQIRQLIEAQALLGESPSQRCTKIVYKNNIPYQKSDYEEQTIELLEKIDHAYPSSRKAAENLMAWFADMKSRYENDEDYDSVVFFCEQEVIKQVLVECKTRGNLLKMIFAYYHSNINQLRERHELSISKICQDYDKKHEKIIKQHNEVVKKHNDIIGELKNHIAKQNNIAQSLGEEIGFYKKKLHDMQRVYLEEQEMWRKQSMEHLRNSLKKGNVFMNDSYNLAIARWRKDLYSVEVMEESIFPEEIKKKIESGEALDLEELKVYRDIYYKKQQELYEKNFLPKETQTDEQFFDDFVEYTKEKSSESPNIVVHTVLLKEKPKEVEKKNVKEKEVQTEEFEDSNEDEDIFDEIKKIISPEDLEEFEEGNEDYDDSFLKKIALLGMRTSLNTGKTPMSWGSGGKNTSNPGFSEFVANLDKNREELGVVEENDEEPIRKALNKIQDSEEDFLGSRKLSDKTEVNISQLDPNQEGKEFSEEENEYFIEVKDQNSEVIDTAYEGRSNKNIRAQEKTNEIKGKNIENKIQGVRGLDINLKIPDKNIDNKGPLTERKDRGLEVKDIRENKDFKSKDRRESKDTRENKDIKESKEKYQDGNARAKGGVEIAKEGFKRSDSNKEKTLENPEGRDRFLLDVGEKKAQKVERSFLADNRDSKNQRLEKSFQGPDSKDLFSDFQGGKKDVVQGKRGQEQIIDSLRKPQSEEDKSLKSSFLEEELPNNSPKETPIQTISKLRLQNDPKNNLQPVSSNASRRVSMPINLQNSSALLQDLLSGKLGKNLKNTTKTLVKNIETKKKELAELESLIEMKKKVLDTSINSEENSSERSNSPKSDRLSQKSKKRHFSSGEIFTRLASKLTRSGDLPNADELKNSENTEKFLRQLITEEMKKAKNQIDTAKKRNSQYTSLSGAISEEEEDEDEIEGKEEEEVNKSEDSPRKFNRGYEIGYQRGRTKGFLTGKTLGREEGIAEGYRQAFKEMNQDDSLIEDSDNESKPLEGMPSLNVPQKIGKMRKPSIQNDIKSTKELTKFAEFKFASQRPAVPKVLSPAPDLVKRLLRKTPESIIKKAKASRKLVNKLMANAYQTALSHMPLESNEELFEICYEEFTQKYGLRKVADRKFLEFVAVLLKNKSYRRPMMFMKLSGLAKKLGMDCYSIQTLSLYIESLNYMLTSKIGITMNYEEADDKNLFPINRAVECVKDKLEAYFDKHFIGSLLSKLEQKSIPDPQRISIALIELEMILEIICEAYEIYLKKIRKGLDEILLALGYEASTPVLQYDLAMAVRFISPSKFQRLESEDIVTQELTQDEAYQLCVEMNVLGENDVNNFVKGYKKVPYENYMDLMMILEKMEQTESTWISVSEDIWKAKLSNCMKKYDQNSRIAVLAWRIYESELRRIQAENL